MDARLLVEQPGGLQASPYSRLTKILKTTNNVQHRSFILGNAKKVLLHRFVLSQTRVRPQSVLRKDNTSRSNGNLALPRRQRLSPQNLTRKVHKSLSEKLDEKAVIQDVYAIGSTQPKPPRRHFQSRGEGRLCWLAKKTHPPSLGSVTLYCLCGFNDLGAGVRVALVVSIFVIPSDVAEPDHSCRHSKIP